MRGDPAEATPTSDPIVNRVHVVHQDDAARMLGKKARAARSIQPTDGKDIPAARNALLQARRELKAAQDNFALAHAQLVEAQERTADAGEAYDRACRGYATERTA